MKSLYTIILNVKQKPELGYLCILHKSHHISTLNVLSINNTNLCIHKNACMCGFIAPQQLKSQLLMQMRNSRVVLTMCTSLAGFNRLSL